MNEVQVIDADGHLIEDLADLARFLPENFPDRHWTGAYPLFPTLDGRYRALQTGATTAEDWIRFLEATGIGVGIIYPTVGLAIGLVRDRVGERRGVALSRAYNDWAYARYRAQDERLRPVAMLWPLEPQAAAEELERSVKELGFAGGLLPSVMAPMHHYGEAWFEPLWTTAERLDCPLIIHGAPQAGLGLEIFDRQIEAHVLEHPLPLFMHLSGMVFEGVFARHPQLRVGFFEAGAGWVPYLMDRMDYEYETRPHDAPAIDRPPSEYLVGGNIYVTVEPEERSLPYVAERFPSQCLLYASDFPHERALHLYREDLDELREREDLSAMIRQQVLRENAERFYAL